VKGIALSEGTSLENKPIRIFVNPYSGNGQGAEFVHQIKEYNPIITDPNQLLKQVQQHITPGDIVVVAGGDGTVSQLIEALFITDLIEEVNLALIPFGTGNDLVRSIGVDPDTAPYEILKSIHNGTRHSVTVPVWKFGGVYFINYVGIGIDGAILQTTDRLRKIFPVNLALIKTLFFLSGLRHFGYRIRSKVHLSVENNILPLLNKAGVIISNIGYYSGGCSIGSQQVTEAEHVSITVLDSIWSYIYLVWGRINPKRKVPAYFTSERVTIQGEPLPVQIDGEVGEFRSAPIHLAGRVNILR